jgi:S-adenosylmethionine/arginine decarboxylase-like enzyme
MASHHFIGNESLAKLIAAQVRSTGLEVVDQRAVGFDNGGLTLVWVLAESHLVLHHWAEEGFATLDRARTPSRLLRSSKR